MCVCVCVCVCVSFVCEGSIYSAKDGGVGTRSICLYKAKSAPGESERGGKSERIEGQRDENRQARTERKRIRRKNCSLKKIL